MSPGDSTALVATLRRLLTAVPAPGLGERCQLCGVEVPEAHAHTLDTWERRLLCTCPPCSSRSARVLDGRYRAVPTRVLGVPTAISQDRWSAFKIPVDLAFFFYNSRLGRIVGFYPGPAGAAESEVSFDEWSALAEDNSLVETIVADVEALLVRKLIDGYECFVVPIDACYELVGRIRSFWAGLGGGELVHREIDAFFAVIRERAEASGRGGQR